MYSVIRFINKIIRYIICCGNAKITMFKYLHWATCQVLVIDKVVNSVIL